MFGGIDGDGTARVGGGSDVLFVEGWRRCNATSGESGAGMGISRDGGRREALFGADIRCGEVSGGLSSAADTGTVRAGGGKDVLFGTGGGGGTGATIAAGAVLTSGERVTGAGGSGRVTRGGAISLSLVSSVESAGARGSPSACVCSAPKSSVAYWPYMVLG